MSAAGPAGGTGTDGTRWVAAATGSSAFSADGKVAVVAVRASETRSVAVRLWQVRVVRPDDVRLRHRTTFLLGESVPVCGRLVDRGRLVSRSVSHQRAQWYVKAQC